MIRSVYQCRYCRHIRAERGLVMCCPACGEVVQYEAIDQVGYVCHVVDVWAIATLAHNLAIGAALCAAEQRGRKIQIAIENARATDRWCDES